MAVFRDNIDIEENEFNEKKMKRFEDLIYSYKKIKRNPIFKDNVELSEELLTIVVNKYFSEIESLKSIGEIDTFGDQYRRAAGTVKWICTIKPLQINLFSKVKLEGIHLLANEVFAITTGMSFLNIHIKTMPKKFFNDFLTILQRCSLDIDLLTVQMYLLEEAYSIK